MLGWLIEQESRADLTPFPFREVRLSQKTTSISLCNQFLFMDVPLFPTYDYFRN